MKTLNIFLISAFLLVCSCKQPVFKYHPGGPYYYKSDIANYQPFRPNLEISMSEAEALAKEGYAYYIAFFNSDGQPTKIEKHYKEKIVRQSELYYQNGKLFKVITSNEDGRRTVELY